MIDTQTDQVTYVKTLARCESLVWSPDGQYLAMVCGDDSWNEWEALVLQLDSAEVVYRTTIQRESTWPNASRIADWPAADWPAHACNVEFPTQQGTIPTCAAPPR